MVQEPQAISMFQSRVFLLRHDSRDGVFPEYLADISFCGSYQLNSFRTMYVRGEMRSCSTRSPSGISRRVSWLECLQE